MARATLRELLEPDVEVQILAECQNGDEALQKIQTLQPDLVFLDIEMPGMGGLEVLDNLNLEKLPLVIFATAYDRYAIRAFDLHAVDYLLKPFDDDRFYEALQRAKQQLRVGTALEMGERLSTLLAGLQTKPPVAGDGPRTVPESEGKKRGDFPEFINVHKQGEIVRIPVDQISWIEAADQYVRIHMTDDFQLMRESMAHLEKLLSPLSFMRIHRSAIVALDQVQSVEYLAGGLARVHLGNQVWIPVSRSRVRKLKQRFSNLD